MRTPQRNSWISHTHTYLAPLSLSSWGDPSLCSWQDNKIKKLSHSLLSFSASEQLETQPKATFLRTWCARANQWKALKFCLNYNLGYGNTFCCSWSEILNMSPGSSEPFWCGAVPLCECLSIRQCCLKHNIPLTNTSFLVSVFFSPQYSFSRHTWTWFLAYLP